MADSSEGFRGALRVDPVLVVLWRGLGALAWLSLSLVAGWGDWPASSWSSPALEALARVMVFLVGSGAIWYGLRRRPAGLLAAGRLEWRGGRARAELAEGEWRGETEVVWRSVALVGVCIRDPQAGRLTLWLTSRRLGASGWWRLQRFLVMGETGRS